MGGSQRRPGSKLVAYEEELLAFAMRYPGAWIDHPWGENVVKVKKKVFVFAGIPSDKLTISVKLPDSRFEALLLPFAEPTGYGLGKSGWVTATFPEGQDPPMGLLSRWIDESYRAVAPKTLLKTLPAEGPGVGKGGAPAAKKTGVKQAAKKKAARRRKA